MSVPKHHRTSRRNRIQVLVLSAAAAAMPFSMTAADQPEPEKGDRSITEFKKEEDAKFQWTVVDDGVMGGLSKGKMAIVDAGVLRFEGVLSLENNGGFSSIRTGRFDTMDLAAHKGLVLRVKGDGRTYQVRLETDARFRGTMAVSFSADLPTTKGEWTEVKVPFKNFRGSWRGRDLPDAKFDPGKIQRLGLLLGDKKPGPFRMEVDWIRAYGGAKDK
ncbi:MAG: CIA30 family protein [Akkermansiaceae bacterium]|nr:CIA30 family protein [Akkermansiaceae bacterium]